MSNKISFEELRDSFEDRPAPAIQQVLGELDRLHDKIDQLNSKVRNLMSWLTVLILIVLYHVFK